MNKFIKEYFNYSQREKRGILILLIIILLAFVFPKVHHEFKKQELWDYTEFETQIDKFIAEQVEIKKKPNSEAKIKGELFFFDPNTLDKIGFLQLGFSKKQTNTIINYRKAGGVFKKPGDFKKVYGISEKMHKIIQPYVRIKDINPKKKYEEKSLAQEIARESYDDYIEKVKENIIFKEVEINSADSLLLTTVRGIGPVFAKRIINYRNYLGGFHSLVQLKEVFGIDDSVYNGIAENLIVDTAFIRKIDLNNAEFKAINKHPYISYAQTKSIFKYRDIMGEFSSLNNLIENNLIDTLTYYKVKPYLVLIKN